MLNMMSVAGSGMVGIAHTHFTLQIEGKITFYMCSNYSTRSDYSVQ